MVCDCVHIRKKEATNCVGDFTNDVTQQPLQEYIRKYLRVFRPRINQSVAAAGSLGELLSRSVHSQCSVDPREKNATHKLWLSVEHTHFVSAIIEKIK